CERDFQVGDKLAMNKLQVISWLLQLAGGRWPHDERVHHDAKIDGLIGLTLGELGGQALVVWGRHTAEILAIAEKIKRKTKFSVDVAYGGTKSTNAATIARFRSGRLRILVAQAKSFQMGQDFSIADAMVYYSNWHDSEVRRQSEERCEHP